MIDMKETTDEAEQGITSFDGRRWSQEETPGFQTVKDAMQLHMNHWNDSDKSKPDKLIMGHQMFAKSSAKYKKSNSLP